MAQIKKPEETRALLMPHYYNAREIMLVYAQMILEENYGLYYRGRQPLPPKTLVHANLTWVGEVFRCSCCLLLIEWPSTEENISYIQDPLFEVGRILTPEETVQIFH